MDRTLKMRIEYTEDTRIELEYREQDRNDRHDTFHHTVELAPIRFLIILLKNLLGSRFTYFCFFCHVCHHPFLFIISFSSFQPDPIPRLDRQTNESALRCKLIDRIFSFIKKNRELSLSPHTIID